MKKIAVVGSRSFTNYTLLKMYLDNLLKEEVIFVSGGANGADKMGEQYAQEMGYKIEQYLADWSNINVKPCVVKYNKYGAYNALAGFNRNLKMLEVLKNNEDGALVVAFWDGKSTGTKHMIEKAKEYGIEVNIVEA